MRRTPQYGLVFYEGGDQYSARDDRERMVTIDHELLDLSRIVGDGVLEGWNISGTGGLGILVSIGDGFISSILHTTLSTKSGTVVDDATTLVYMRSKLIGLSGSLLLNAESPLSNPASAAFVDATAPSAPTGFVVTAVDFDVVNLTWDANGEGDLDRYRVERDVSAGFPSPTLVGGPTANGTIGDPLQDTGLTGGTTYFYRLSALDTSGNQSAFATDSTTTLPDVTTAGEVTNLRLFPDDGEMFAVWDGSPSDDVTSYLISTERLNPNGTVAETLPDVSVGPTVETYRATGLVNGQTYRITVRARNSATGLDPLGNLNTGVSAEASPFASPAPANPTGLAVTPLANSVKLDWTASASPSGGAVGQKSAYVIRVLRGTTASAPINVGLVTTKTLNNFNAAAAVGQGAVQFFEDDVTYLFQLTAQDAFGNESAGVFAKGATIDTTAPNNPRLLSAEAGDEQVLLTWRHGSSEDVVGYNVAVDTGSGFGPDAEVGFVEEYLATGLTNGTLATFRVRSRDDAGNLSSGTNTVATPAEDTTPPPVPNFVKVETGDEQARLGWAETDADDLSHYVVRRQAIAEPIDTPPNRTHTVLSESFFNVGTDVNFVDVGLINDQVYTYSVQSVDLRGNESDFSFPILAQPTEGTNTGDDRLEPPVGLTATFVPATGIVLTWTFTPPVGEPHTNFNVYRSTMPYSGFALVASVGPTTLTHTDVDLVDGITYYYHVSAVRDGAELLLDTGSIQPANTILLGIVRASSGTITSITNTQRVVDNLEATLGEEVSRRLLAHRHSVKPQNSSTVTAVGTLEMIDAADLDQVDVEVLTSLSSEALTFYQDTVTNPRTGQANVFDARTSYVINPAAVVSDLPLARDFQVLVDGSVPTQEFSIDDSRNMVVFSAPLPAGSVVSLDGQFLTYYAPVSIKDRLVSFEVLVNGTVDPAGLVNEATQTIRFPAALSANSVVSLEVAPTVPDFGTQDGARQVNLSPDIVLSDFEARTRRNFLSASGGFEAGDTVFVLVDGERTTLPHFVDFEQKSIVFDDPLPLGSTVALEILGKEEVDGTLPAEKVGDLDASQFASGTFLKAQLPPISHNGRIRERARPIFSETTSPNNYAFQAEAGTLGSATTPYAILQRPGGELWLGTSRGLVRSVNGVFLGPGDSANLGEDQTGLVILDGGDVVALAADARRYSGRTRGQLLLENLGLTMSDPVLVPLDDGRVLLAGGVNPSEGGLSPARLASQECFLYTPTTSTWATTGNMATRRRDHAAVLLPSGKVLVSGGTEDFYDAGGSETGGLQISLDSCELFDPGTGAWTTTGAMADRRSLHAMAVIDPESSVSDVLVAGGEQVISAVPTSETTILGTSYSVVFGDLESAERFSTSLTWASTTAMPRPAKAALVSTQDSHVLVDTFENRQVYDGPAETWTLEDPVEASDAGSATAAEQLDGPVKQFFEDSTGAILLVTRNNVFLTRDGGRNFEAMRGLEAVGVVHRVSEDAGGTLYAATDLGVYEITPALREQDTWFQGGLIGSGTTEVFALQPNGSGMLAASEIGIFRTTDGGDTWVELVALDDAFNLVGFEGSVLFANSGEDLYRSDDDGATWDKQATLSFLDPDARLVSRPPHLLAATAGGLYASTDGVGFSLVDFDLNRNPNRNNLHMADVLGADVLVGYDNTVLAVGPNLEVSPITEFAGVIPTVTVNDVEARNGFRYDTVNSAVVFERKRLVGDEVRVAANYGLFAMEGGSWYEQNPAAHVQAFVNGRPADATTSPRLGQIAFAQPVRKFDVVTASIANVTLSDAGERFHDELQDKLALEKGLPFFLGRNYEGNLLQLGLSVEHNFLERGLDRNQYYCLTGSFVDRSFTSFLQNSSFFILGRKDYDVFNSTIDFVTESEQLEVGPRAFAPLSSLEFSASELWVGTDSGIFVLDQTAGFVVSETIEVGAPKNPVRDMAAFNGDVLAATATGLFLVGRDLSGDAEVTRNPGNNLPADVLSVAVLNDVVVAGTADAIYWSDASDDPPNETWFRAAFVEEDGATELPVEGSCNAITVRDGTAFAAIGGLVLTSTDGKTWRRVFQFQPPPQGEAPTVVNRLATFAERLFLGTNKGVFNDDGSARSDVVGFRLELVKGTEEDSESLHVNDLFAAEDALYVAVNEPRVYVLRSEDWFSLPIPEPSAHEFLVTNGGAKVGISNNIVFVE